LGFGLPEDGDIDIPEKILRSEEDGLTFSFTNYCSSAINGNILNYRKKSFFG
jgi:hypothetical protein